MQGIQNIIFDLGGVLIDLDMQATINAIHQLGVNNFQEHLKNSYVSEGFLGAFEKGQVEPGDFRNKIRELAKNTTLTDAQIDKAWCSMLTQVPSYKLDLLRQLNKKYRVFMLSNTNKIHIEYILPRFFQDEKYRLNDYFESCFLSNELGLSKPDPEIFKAVIDKTGIKSEETFFIDDAPANIKTAREMGFYSYLYTLGEDLHNIGL